MATDSSPVKPPCEDALHEIYHLLSGEIDDAKRTEIFKGLSKLIGDEVEKVSWWTTNALSAKTKRLEGVKIPPNSREFIVGVQNWVLNP